MDEITKLIAFVEQLLANPLIRTLLVTVMISGLVTLFRMLGREKISPQEATGVDIGSGRKNTYRRRADWRGYLDWGKGHWLQAAVLALLAYVFELVPQDYDLMTTVSLMTLGSIGIHSATKNSKQSGPVAAAGAFLAEKVRGKLP